MNTKEICMLENMEKIEFETKKEIKKAISFLKAYSFNNGFIRDYMISFLEQKLLEAVIEDTASNKARHHLKGLVNLLNDKNPYNDSILKDTILKELKNIKSFKSFKVVNVSTYNLKKGYKHLAYKNGAILNYSKIIRLEKNCYLIKTVLIDGLNLKLIAPSFKLKSLEKRLLSKSKAKNTLDFKKEVGNPSDFNYSSVDAWKHLKKGDNIAFYSYLNQNGLDKSNRQLLRSIRKMKGGKPFYDSIADAEEAIFEIKDSLDEYYSSDEPTLSVGDLVHREWELKSLEDFVSSFGVEDNSMSSKSTLEDYLPPMWKENSF